MESIDNAGTLYYNGTIIEYDNIVTFENDNTNIFDVFFFKDGFVVSNQYLSLFELDKIKKPW